LQPVRQKNQNADRPTESCEGHAFGVCLSLIVSSSSDRSSWKTRKDDLHIYCITSMIYFREDTPPPAARRVAVFVSRGILV